MQLVLAGVMLMGLSIVPLSMDINSSTNKRGCHAACQSFPWMCSIGFSWTFSALWAKTHRVNRLMVMNQDFRRMTVSAADVAKPMLIVLLANVITLSIWTATDPLRCDTEIMVWNAFGQPVESRGYCASDNAVWYLVALAVINLGPLVFAVYEAWKARDISSEYAETTYILKALTVICLACFMGFPVLIIAYDNPSAFYFVLTAIIFVVCISILLLIIAPKLKAFYGWSLCSTNNSHVPLPFSRRHEIARNQRLAHEVNPAILSEQSSSSAPGLIILSRPPTLVVASLEEENRQLRVQNEELKKSSTYSSQNDSGTDIEKLRKENQDLRQRLLDMQPKEPSPSPGVQVTSEELSKQHGS